MLNEKENKIRQGGVYSVEIGNIVDLNLKINAIDKSSGFDIGI